jgi:2-polyprenyl-3-methyl-5-hydroxy-6-metoxy-1,4-benzoquinol methylase
MRLNKVLPYISGRVLDVGCLNGEIIPLLGDGAVEYVGVDINRGAIEAMKVRYPEHEFFCLDVQEEAVPGGEPFETLVVLATIEHLEDPDAFLERYVPLMGPRALIVITTPSPWGERMHRMLQKVHITRKSIKELHHTIFPLRGLEQLMTRHGLDVIRARRFELGMNQLIVARKPL